MLRKSFCFRCLPNRALSPFRADILHWSTIFSLTVSRGAHRREVLRSCTAIRARAQLKPAPFVNPSTTKAPAKRRNATGYGPRGPKFVLSLDFAVRNAKHRLPRRSPLTRVLQATVPERGAVHVRLQRRVVNDQSATAANAGCRHAAILDSPVSKFVTAHFGRRHGNAIERNDLIENQQPREFPAMPPSVKPPEART
jgi:hypothetical protein